MFIEINLRKTKLLFFGVYRSENRDLGVSDVEFYEQVGLALDKYSSYDKFLLAGDFNMEEDDEALHNFLYERNAKNLVKEKTCFKSVTNPSCIDLLITDSPNSFQHTTTVPIGLSDCHKMAVTVLKTTFPKAPPKVITYRDYKNFILEDFRKELRTKIRETTDLNYNLFEKSFLDVLEKHAPTKKKTVRQNNKPYMTRTLRKAIMRRSALWNRFLKEKTAEAQALYKKQKNYTNKLLKKERKKYFGNLDLKNFTDNKKFWNTIKPLFSKSNGGSRKITLVENEEVITDDKEVAETFNTFFDKAVTSLDININPYLLNDPGDLKNPVDIALKKFESHPSILDIKKNVVANSTFVFSKVTPKEMVSKIKQLNPRKSGTFMNIPATLLKEVKDIAAEPLTEIWNTEIILNEKFPTRLKLADITPLFKKLENVSKENYRPVSLLPLVSKIFERIMQEQMIAFIGDHLSPYLCGYRKGYNAQYALIAMIEKWKKSLDKGGMFAAVLMDLSKAFDTINHELLIAKLHAYGFEKSALSI